MDKKIRVAFMYDFDETLMDGFMQNYGLIESLGMTNDEFWAETNNFAIAHNMDNTNAYLYKLVEVANRKGINLTREYLASFAKNLPLFGGVSTFFDRINEYAKQIGIELEHYVISTGNKEIIEATSIGSKFNRIFACEYCYNEEGNPVWVAHNVNYTTKTQYIYRIRKNLIDKLYDAKEINQFVQDRESLLPYSNMLYFGDGFTDVPSMKTLTTKGGNTICVYTQNTKQNAMSLLKEGRVNHIALANYGSGSKIEEICKTILNSIKLKTEE